MRFIDDMFDGMYEREFFENLRNNNVIDIAQLKRNLRSKYDKFSAFTNAGIKVLASGVLAGIAYLAKERGFTDTAFIMNIGSGGIAGVSFIKLLNDLKNSNKKFYNNSPVKSDLSTNIEELIKLQKEGNSLLTNFSTEREEKIVQRPKKVFLDSKSKLCYDPKDPPETYQLMNRYNIAVDHNQFKYAINLLKKILQKERRTLKFL